MDRRLMVARLVAFDAERAAAEKAETVRRLRPDYQVMARREAKGERMTYDLSVLGDSDRLKRMSVRLVPIVAALLLSACASYAPVRDTPVRIGRPYTVRGVTYTPAADPGYDVLGYASWYGSESGNRAANGEKFRPKAIAGAHPTLPLPSYVEVTSLDTGRTILVRVNDRGPFARGRILDLSRGAAQQLGARAAGIIPVRVRVAKPPERDRARLRAGKPARERPRLGAAALASLRAQLAAGERAGVLRR